MKVTLTEELETFVRKKVRTGRYVDESDVVRDALREGVRSPHRPYGNGTLNRIRKTARRGK
jgi:putative addiction module CopG family antidote